MEGVLSTEISSKNTAEPTKLEICSHEQTKKVRKFGKKCALCQTRVWKFWKTRKCLDCKSILHKSCITAWKKENAENSTAQATAAIDATTETISLVQATVEAKEMTSAETTVRPSVEEMVGDEFIPLYVTPTPWIFANTTTVTVDCRGRPKPLTVVVSHGHELSAAVFAGLFDVLPARSFVTEWSARDAGDNGQSVRRPGAVVRRGAPPYFGVVLRLA